MVQELRERLTQRNIGFSDEDWARAMAAGRKRGTTASAWIRALVRQALRREVKANG